MDAPIIFDTELNPSDISKNYFLIRSDMYHLYIVKILGPENLPFTRTDSVLNLDAHDDVNPHTIYDFQLHTKVRPDGNRKDYSFKKDWSRYAGDRGLQAGDTIRFGFDRPAYQITLHKIEPAEHFPNPLEYLRYIDFLDGSKAAHKRFMFDRHAYQITLHKIEPAEHFPNPLEYLRYIDFLDNSKAARNRFRCVLPGSLSASSAVDVPVGGSGVPADGAPAEVANH